MTHKMQSKLLLLLGILAMGTVQADYYWNSSGIDFADPSCWDSSGGNCVFGGYGTALRETGEGGTLCTFSKAESITPPAGLWVETRDSTVSVIWRKADNATDDAGLTVKGKITVGTGLKGDLVIKSGTFSCSGDFYVTDGTSSSTLDIEKEASLSSGGECVFVTGKGGEATVTLNGGRFLPRKLWIGSRFDKTADACSATFTMNGGYLQTNNGDDIVVGGHNNATGKFLMNGGEVRCGKQFFVPWRGNGVLIMKGGDIYIPAAYDLTICQESSSVSSDVQLYGGLIHTDKLVIQNNGTSKNLLVDGGGFAPVSNKADWLASVTIPVGEQGIVLDTDGFDATLAATLEPKVEGGFVKVIKKGAGTLTLPMFPENYLLSIEEGMVKLPTGATLEEGAVTTAEQGAVVVDPNAEDAEAVLLRIKDANASALTIYVTGCEKVLTTDEETGDTLVKAGASFKVDGEPCTWLGTYSTKWNDLRNWSWSRVPADNEPITIPAGKTVYRDFAWTPNGDARITGAGEIVMAKAPLTINWTGYFGGFEGTLTIQEGCYVWDSCGLHGEGGDVSSGFGNSTTVRLAGGCISRFGSKGGTNNEHVYNFEVVEGTVNEAYNYESRDSKGGCNVNFRKGIRGGGKLSFASSFRTVTFNDNFSNFTGELELRGYQYAFSSFQNGTCRVKAGANLTTTTMAVGSPATFLVEGDVSWVNYTIAAQGTFGGGANTKVASIAFDPESKFSFIDNGALSDTTQEYVGFTSKQPITVLPKIVQNLKTPKGLWKVYVRENTTTSTDETTGETTTTVDSYSLCAGFNAYGFMIYIR